MGAYSTCTRLYTVNLWIVIVVKMVIHAPMNPPSKAADIIAPANTHFSTLSLSHVELYLVYIDQCNVDDITKISSNVFTNYILFGQQMCKHYNYLVHQYK